MKFSRLFAYLTLTLVLLSVGGYIAADVYYTASSNSMSCGTSGGGGGGGTGTTYTPTLVNVGNTSDLTVIAARYYQVGSVVSVDMKVDFTATLLASSAFTFTIPVATAGGGGDGLATFHDLDAAAWGVGVVRLVTASTAQVEFTSGGAGDDTNIYIHYTYIVS